jgi:hypothetical protein
MYMCIDSCIRRQFMCTDKDGHSIGYIISAYAIGIPEHTIMYGIGVPQRPIGYPEKPVWPPATPPYPQPPMIICPVCKGRTTMPKGFYPDDPKTEHPPCRSCGKTGVIRS